jgi:hypothetical protein
MRGNRRARDAAILLPLGGLLLFLPPYVRLFDQPGDVFGVPLLHVYIFSLWLIGIVLTALLARRLAVREGEELGSDSDDGEAPPGEE